MILSPQVCKCSKITCMMPLFNVVKENCDFFFSSCRFMLDAPELMWTSHCANQWLHGEQGELQSRNRGKGNKHRTAANLFLCFFVFFLTSFLFIMSFI